MTEAFLEERCHRCAGAAVFVERAVYDALQAGSDHRARTHRAGFERDVQRAVRKPPVFPVSCRFLDREDLGVSSRTVLCFADIVTAPDHFAVFVRDDRADGDLSERRRFFSFLDREKHHFLIV